MAITYGSKIGIIQTPIEVELKKGPDKKGKVKVKKMVVADPGLLMELSFSEEEAGDLSNIGELKMVCSLKISGQNNEVLTFVMNGGGSALDLLSASIQVVIPFIDDAMAPHEEDVTFDTDFTLTPSSGDNLTGSESTDLHGLERGPDYYRYNPNHHLGKDGGSFDPDRPAGASYTLTDVAVMDSVSGVSGLIQYDNIQENMATSLQNSSNPDLRSYFRIDDASSNSGQIKRVFYLPFPRVADLTPSDYEIQVGTTATSLNGGSHSGDVQVNLDGGHES
ncbi:MAG: hypothetical protein AAF206_16890 [Bacteroidota bacterium]